MKRRTIAILAISLALLGGAAMLRLRSWRPIGNGPAGPPVPAESFAKPWTQSPVVLVGFGDSVTAGFGAEKGYSYFDRLLRNPENEFEDMRGRCLSAVLPDLRSVNLAVSGSTSDQHLESQIPKLPAAGPDVIGLVVLTTGGNDLIHNYGRTPPKECAMFGASWDQATPWIKNFEQRLQTMLDQIQSRFPGGCHVFLATIYDPTDGRGDIEHAGLPAWKDGSRILAAYNEVIVRAAESHRFVHPVDIHSLFLGHGIHCSQFWSRHYDSRDPHYWYFANLEDPNERGYDAIRRLFLLEISKTADQIGSR